MSQSRGSYLGQFRQFNRISGREEGLVPATHVNVFQSGDKSLFPTAIRVQLSRAATGFLVALILLLLTACSNRVLLDERFHDQRLDDWTVIDDPDVLEGPSNWRVEGDGWVHQRSNVWGLRGDFIGRWCGT